jgi:hypothetical protein
MHRSRKYNKTLYGFTLLEAVIGIGLIAVITAALWNIGFILLNAKRAQNLIIASYIATNKIENLRQTKFEFPPSGNFSDPMLSYLPEGEAFLSVEDYEGISDMKHIYVEIKWKDLGVVKSYRLDTIISKQATNPPNI